MKAPEKIYLLPRQGGDYAPYWKTDSQDGFGIEYTRTDAFIEKAKKWVKERAELFLLKTPMCDYYDYKKAVKDFEKYMKGE